MKIQVQARWIDNSPKSEDKEELKLKRLIEGDDDDQEEDLNYVYHPLVLDTKDIKSFNELDERHSTIRMYGGDMFTILVSFEGFKEVLMSLTQENINIIIEEEVFEDEEEEEDF